jgi:hypothetical protein
VSEHLKSGDVFDCEFVVCDDGEGALIAIPDCLREGEILDGRYLSDNQFTNVPKQAGHYRAKVEYEYIPGYYEGYRAPGEDDWYFHIRECVDVLATERQRAETAEAQLAVERERSRRLQLLMLVVAQGGDEDVSISHARAVEVIGDSDMSLVEFRQWKRAELEAARRLVIDDWHRRYAALAEGKEAGDDRK